MHTVDTRGLSCPQPLVMIHDLIQDSTLNELDVLVDNQASLENITRAATKQGFQVTPTPEGEADVIKLQLRRN